jgi:D-alanine-D-alanine ligase
MPITINVLGGGPDAEREVSLNSSAAVAKALAANPKHQVTRTVIDRISIEELRAMPGDVFFPVLHGGFGEGGPLQDLLEADGRPYVGCRPLAARTCMDKLATKLVAATHGVATKPAAVFNPRDAGCPLPYPVVMKPIHEGSSVGVRFARDAKEYGAAAAGTQDDMRQHPARSYMIEHAVPTARELTVGMLDGQPLPIIEIRPKVEFYDYDAKYNRNDTQYTVDPVLPEGLARYLAEAAARLYAALEVRHLCRIDFLVDAEQRPWLLEVNTMPGFTDHSLVPKAAAKIGFNMTTLTTRLIELAIAGE